MTYPIPRDAFDDRFAIVGTAGSGKTYLALGAVEHLLARKARVIMVDPLGVAWGLRLGADGETPSPFQPVIFGGPHGDLPISEHAGAIIGEAVATSRDSCIVDLSELGTKASERRFMLAFLTALYRHTDREPVHLIVDEADMFAPQVVSDKDGEAAKLLGMMETIVRRGRVRGFIPWLISQRPAVLNKNVLSQSDGLIAMKLTSSQDRDQLGDWVEGQADRAEWKAMRAELATLPRGDGVIWIPARGILSRATFPTKATFDSSRTPKRGETVTAAALKPINLTALREKLGKVEAEVAANDPSALKARIRTLEAEARKNAASDQAAKINTADQVALDAANADGYRSGWLEGHKIGIGTARAALKFATERICEKLVEASGLIDAQAFAQEQERPKPRPAPVTSPKASVLHQAPSRHKPIPQSNGGGMATGGAELRILRVLAARHPARFTKPQWATLARMKRTGGTWQTYVSRLRTAGYIDEGGGLVGCTEAGLAAAGECSAQGDVLEQWKSALGSGPSKMIDQLMAAHPDGLDRANLADLTGMTASGGTFQTYLSRLKSNGLVEVSGRRIALSEAVFM